MYPLPRPQSLQRRTTRDLNFGVRSARRIKAFLAMMNETTSASDYVEFSSEFSPFLAKIPRTSDDKC